MKSIAALSTVLLVVAFGKIYAVDMSARGPV